MKWTDPNTAPHGMLYPSGHATVIGATGTGIDGLLWYWEHGSEKFSVVKKGTFTATGELQDSAGKTVGWISPVRDMPQLENKSQAEHYWREARKETDTDGFKNWMAYQATVYGPVK